MSGMLSRMFDDLFLAPRRAEQWQAHLATLDDVDLRVDVCPACGGDGRFEVVYGWNYQREDVNSYEAECSCCGGTGFAVTETELIDKFDLEELEPMGMIQSTIVHVWLKALPMSLHWFEVDYDDRTFEVKRARWLTDYGNPRYTVAVPKAALGANVGDRGITLETALSREVVDQINQQIDDEPYLDDEPDYGGLPYFRWYQ